MEHGISLAEVGYMARSVKLSACMAGALVAASVALNAAAHVTRAQRLEAIRHARVWAPTAVEKMNITAGPSGPQAFRPGETVSCDFVPHSHGKGHTQKFACRMRDGRELKVRYWPANGEVYAHVAASRLLWALGFPAYPMYPVKVICHGCDGDPFRQAAPIAGAKPVVFDPATIEEKLPGTTIETKPDEGWAWSELDKVDEAAGGAPRRERDALRLLAVLIQHSSNKPINQRILCLDKPACTSTEMIILDAGNSFGRANVLNNHDVAAVNLKEWSRMGIWKGARGCEGNLSWSLSGSLSDPSIGEDGRAFLSGLLGRLTDAQLHDLFAVARFTTRDPHATVDDWVAAFKRKRDEIAARHCQG
jgi:hypothetical protein